MQLHRHVAPVTSLRRFVRQPAAELTEQRQTFAAPDGAAHFRQLLGEPIDAARQVSQLVVTARQRPGAKIALSQPRHLRTQLMNRAAEPAPLSVRPGA